MSYVRPARKDEIIAFLDSIDWINLSAEQLADALIVKYDLVGYFKTAT